jgi:phosphate-selective porin OprO and OprP
MVRQINLVTRLRRWQGARVLLFVLLALMPAAGYSQTVSQSAASQGQPNPPTVSAGSDGFIIQSSTGDYRLQFGLLLQGDGRFAVDDEDEAVVDSFGLHRVRTFVRGRVGQRFEFYVNPDFGNGTFVLQDAYIDTRFWPAFIVRVGKGKVPFGLERLTPVSTIVFFERGLPNGLVPNRDLGIQVLGDLRGGIVSYAAAVMNGVPDGGSGDADSDDGKDLIGRIVVRPFGPQAGDRERQRPSQGLTLAIAGTTGHQSGALPTIRTSSLFQSFVTYTGATADGRLNRYSPQASYYYKRFGAFTEYVHTSVPMRRAEVRQRIWHRAWQIASSFALTNGDIVTDRGVRPVHNFDFGHGHLGALLLSARYHTLSVDDEAITLGLATAGSSGEAKAWTLGLNWYVNPNLKYVVNFERTTFDESAAAPRHAENAIVFRAQASF